MSDTPDSDTFTFAMGDFLARFPRDLLYAKNHMWARPTGDFGSDGRTRYRFGLTAYAVRLLQDVYFLDWEIDPPTPLRSRQMMGSIESKKAESDLYAPLGGTLAAINDAVLADPALINAAAYADGWLFEIDATPEESATLLDPNDYAAHLQEAWEVAQRTIKGQANV